MTWRRKAPGLHMSDRISPWSDRFSPPSDRCRRDPVTDAPAVDLQFVSVEYADGPDRCTIHPPDSAAVTTTWLTADREDFVDLSTCQ